MFLTLLLAGSLLTSPTHPHADRTRYYFLLFGGQSVPYKPRTAHTWATYVKVTPTTDGTLSLEPITISWLPADGRVEPFRLRAVPGRNYPLAETFEMAQSQNARISVWGPFEIDADRYQMAINQAQLLESGAIRYRVLDSFRGNRSTQHCVHAVTYADPIMQHSLQPVIQVGEPGTSRLARKYLRAGAIASGATTQDWLIPALGIDAYGVIHREPGEWIVRRIP